MDAKTCLQKLQYVGVLAFSTVDEYGNPQVRNISAIHYEPEAMYFFTARGKDFCKELLADGRVQLLGYTKYKEMIRLTARAVPVPQDEQEAWINTIFDEQPYLSNVYPGDTRKIGIVFAIQDAEIEYFHLGVNPIFRESYVIGKGTVSRKGYQITDACIGCGKCARNCPQRCITAGEAYMIQQEHFPNDEAAKIAVKTVNAYKSRTKSEIEVIFNVFKDEDHEIYKELLRADRNAEKQAERGRCCYHRSRGRSFNLGRL